MSAPASTSGLTTYTLDPAYTTVEFSGKHMMFATVKGQFRKVDGTIQLDAADLSRSSVDVTIDAGSLESGQEMRDGHLKSADFLHVEEHPTLTFKSTSVEARGDDLKVTGDLTIHGVTKSVVLDAEFNGTGKNPWGKQVISYSASTKVNRKDFGLNWNAALEAGGMLVSDDVKISIEIEAIS